MNNPKVTALISGLVAIYLAYSIFGATETPSTTVSAMRWVFFALAVIGCVGSVYQLTKGGRGGVE